MDAWVLNLKSGSLIFKDVSRFVYDSKRVSEFRVPKFLHGCQPLVVTAAAGKKKNRDDDHFNSGNRCYVRWRNDESTTDLSSGNSEESSKFDDSTHRISPLNWRDFRAELVRDELLNSSDTPKSPSHKLGPKWAHPLSEIEPGCILVATEKLDGVRNFERSVVLLLRLGTRDPREGPFGVIINRPLHKKIKHINPSNPDLATTFSGCSLHFGGPLDTSMFLFKHGDKPIPGFDQVIPGVSYGARNSLDEAANLVKKGLVKAEDFRFFVGYAGWEFEQLREEIADNYWVVSACSSYFINGGEAADGLWGEILQLMGGPYSELSRKPKREGL